MSFFEKSLIEHEKHKGKIEIASKVTLKTIDDFCIYYTPGVSSTCRKIMENPNDVYRFTAKSNLIAVVTDGSSVSGLGDIGALASIPVMEGKSVLFKEFGGIDAIPICLDTKDVDKIVETVVHISPILGGVNLEDISSPRSAEIERALDRALSIPVFHDDQHGTAIVVTAALLNSLKATGREGSERSRIKIRICGAGSAGLAIAKMLREIGFVDICFVERNGILHRQTDLNWYQREVIESLSSSCDGKTMADALKQADVFIGVSSGTVLDQDLVRTMARDPIIFALANPEPEIYPDAAVAAGAKVVATGRSDFPNQINNLLAFPGVFRGALDAKSKITPKMKYAAAMAIANAVSNASIANGIVVPSAMDKKVHQAVAEAVYMASLSGTKN